MQTAVQRAKMRLRRCRRGCRLRPRSRARKPQSCRRACRPPLRAHRLAQRGIRGQHGYGRSLRARLGGSAGGARYYVNQGPGTRAGSDADLPHPGACACLGAGGDGHGRRSARGRTVRAFDRVALRREHPTPCRRPRESRAPWIPTHPRPCPYYHRRDTSCTTCRA
jgi:hypothetical protein